MIHLKLRVLETLLSDKNPEWMLLDDLTRLLKVDEDVLREALIELQDDDLVFLRSGWYTASAYARKALGH